MVSKIVKVAQMRESTKMVKAPRMIAKMAQAPQMRVSKDGQGSSDERVLKNGQGSSDESQQRWSRQLR